MLRILQRYLLKKNGNKPRRRTLFSNGVKINPGINFYQLEYYLKDSLNPRLIKNTQIYSLVKELTSRFYPSWDNLKF